MLFNSYLFIFIFLPLCIVGYFLLNKFHIKAAMIFLLGMSLWFYGYFNYSYLFIICSSIIINFTASKLLQDKRFFKLSKLVLSAALIFNLGLIFYFKYYDFFVENMNHLFHSDFVLKQIVLPLGISFFTFQQISYIVDSYYGKTRDYGFIEYALFVTYFPQLVAGPIVLHNELIPQFREHAKKKINYENLSRGIILFTLGLFKKIIIADTFGRAVTWGYSNVEIASSMDMIIVMLSYTFQIYFDFSGYSDMATGIASMFNFTLPMNFNSPYKSSSIVEFWQRWHMTLTRFLRTYIYFPLGGSRGGVPRTYLNILIVFLCSGIWHGANWTFILWGLLHGVANIVTRFFQDSYKKLHIVWQWVLTFGFLNITWVLFRSDSISQWITILKKIGSLSDLRLNGNLLSSFSLIEFDYLFKVTGLSYFNHRISGFSMLLFLIGSFWICLNCKNNYEKHHKLNAITLLGTLFLLIWSVVSLSSVSVFLYFNF